MDELKAREPTHRVSLFDLKLKGVFIDKLDGQGVDIDEPKARKSI